MFSQGISSLEAAAKEGDAKAMYNLAMYYAVGKGVSKSKGKASNLLEKSAELGYTDAMYRLATMYKTGSGLKKNPQKALEWFKKAAENGYALSQIELGNYYAGINDITNSAYWYGQAAEQGNQEARRILNTTDYGKIYSSQKTPPYLEVVPGSIHFVDNTQMNTIGANGKYAITFSLKNSGKGNAYNCKVKVSAQGNTQALTFKDQTIGVVRKGEVMDIVIPITSGFSTTTGKVDFAIQVDEPNGFGTDPQYLSVNTRAYVEPLMMVADYTLTNSAGNTTLKKKLPFDLQLLVQNTKQGKAEDVVVNVTVPQDVILVEGEKNINFKEVDGGEVKSLVYSMIISNNYTASTVPIKVHITEKYGRYAEDKTINLTFDQTFASSKVSIEAKELNKKNISLASLSSDVDKNIPETSSKQKNTFAVIIANENYSQVASVPFAINDGSIFKEYCQRTLGIPTENIHFVADATLGELTHQIDWLKQVMKAYNGEAKAIFYYAGHGIPDEASKNAYILPVDGYGNNTKSALSLDDFYKSLSLLPSQSITLFLDACFSGANRDGGMLASARGVAIKAKQNQPVGNLVVFSAAQGDETALPYKEQYHGMFTYYLLKKLKETEGKVTLGELGTYVKDQVKKQSIVINGKSQTPSISSSVQLLNSWENIKMR